MPEKDEAQTEKLMEHLDLYISAKIAAEAPREFESPAEEELVKRAFAKVVITKRSILREAFLLWRNRVIK